jgi:hypothetical protein
MRWPICKIPNPKSQIPKREAQARPPRLRCDIAIRKPNNTKRFGAVGAACSIARGIASSQGTSVDDGAVSASSPGDTAVRAGRYAARVSPANIAPTLAYLAVVLMSKATGACWPMPFAESSRGLDARCDAKAANGHRNPRFAAQWLQPPRRRTVAVP